MPRGGMFFLLLILMSVGLLTLLWPMIPSAQQALNKKNSAASGSKNNLFNQQAAVVAARKPAAVTVSANILAEASRTGMTDQDPVASEKRLDLLAGNLTDEEIISMAEVVRQPSSDGDLRALAVDLLARNKGPQALQSLEQIIISKWSESTDPRRQGFEQSLRARAIEGLEGHPAPQATARLQSALSQVQDTFLNDHGQRALLHRQGQARSVQEQDEEALQKILKH